MKITSVSAIALPASSRPRGSPTPSRSARRAAIIPVSPRPSWPPRMAMSSNRRRDLHPPHPVRDLRQGHHHSGNDGRRRAADEHPRRPGNPSRLRMPPERDRDHGARESRLPQRTLPDLRRRIEPLPHQPHHHQLHLPGQSRHRRRRRPRQHRHPRSDRLPFHRKHRGRKRRHLQRHERRDSDPDRLHVHECCQAPIASFVDGGGNDYELLCIDCRGNVDCRNDAVDAEDLGYLLTRWGSVDGQHRRCGSWGPPTSGCWWGPATEPDSTATDIAEAGPSVDRWSGHERTDQDGLPVRRSRPARRSTDRSTATMPPRGNLPCQESIAEPALQRVPGWSA